MTPINRKILLLKKRVTQTTLAKCIGADRTNVTKVLTNNRKTPWIRAAIAEFLNIEYNKFWGNHDK